MSQTNKYVPWIVVVIIAIVAIAAIALIPPRVVEKPVEKTVVKEVPVEKVVEKPVVKEVPVEKVVTKEVVKEVPKKVDIVQFQTAYTPQGKDGYLWVALDKGYYEQEGISTRIFRGMGGLTTATNVDQGQFNFGWTDMSTVMKVRGRGGQLKMVMLMEEKSPIGYVAFKDSGIKTPKDFEGRKVAYYAGETGYEILGDFLKVNGVDYSKLIMVNIAPDVSTTAFLNGQVDLTTAYEDSFYQIVIGMAKKQGKEIQPIWFRDWGFDVYGYGVLTTDKLIKENPDLVRRFVKATVKGLTDTINNPEEAANIVMKYNEALTKEFVVAQIKAFANLAKSPIWEQKGYGWMDDAKMAKTRDLYAKILGFDIPVKDIYTNEFLPGKP